VLACRMGGRHRSNCASQSDARATSHPASQGCNIDTAPSRRCRQSGSFSELARSPLTKLRMLSTPRVSARHAVAIGTRSRSAICWRGRSAIRCSKRTVCLGVRVTWETVRYGMSLLLHTQPCATPSSNSSPTVEPNAGSALGAIEPEARGNYDTGIPRLRPR
jgi:hypothetical protein